jgi:hypothetical protein
MQYAYVDGMKTQKQRGESHFEDLRVDRNIIIAR